MQEEKIRGLMVCGCFNCNVRVQFDHESSESSAQNAVFQALNDGPCFYHSFLHLFTLPEEFTALEKQISL